MALDTLSQALEKVGTRKPHLLLGNGFARALRDDLFSYDALYGSAEFAGLSKEGREAFDVLETSDFEVVMRTLRSAASVLKAYAPTQTALREQLEKDIGELREILARTIAKNHLERPGDVTAAQYSACRTFLSQFQRVYTTNYDLLLYWTIMQDEGPVVPHDDGFRTPDAGEAAYVSWDVEKTDAQDVFYLHGALHIFDAGPELQKYTWKGTGVPLLDQIKEALGADKFPLFVAEGESREKMTRIMRSNYLGRGYRSFAKIGGALFVVGHALGASDSHWLHLLEVNRLSTVAVGLFGDPESKQNSELKERLEAVSAKRGARRPLQIAFFDSASAKIWG